MDERKPPTTQFGQAIRSSRQAKEISLRALARGVGISPTYLSKIERGHFPAPTQEKVEQLAEELDLDVDKLLALAGRIATDVQAAILKHPREIAGLILAAAELSPVEIENLTREAAKRKPRKRKS